LTIDRGHQPGGEITASREGFEELVAAAGHAGSVVREQVGTIVEAAQTNAADIERRSKESADATKGEARAAADRILELLRTAERQVGDLRRSVAREADAVRVALGKSALRSGPALGLGRGDALDSVATPFEAEIGPPADAEAVDEPEATGEAEPEGETSGDATDETAVSEVVTDVPEVGAEEATEEGADEEAAEAANDAAPAEPGAGALEAAITRAKERGASGASVQFGGERHDDDARRRVAGKADEELAEAYEIAVEARAKAEQSGNAEEVEYWGMLVRAAVADAVDRPSFGELSDGEQPLGRRQRRRREKKLKSLALAREQALGGGPPAGQEADQA
jgi:hypothetical protein